jgi:hypothetical protein
LLLDADVPSQTAGRCRSRNRISDKIQARDQVGSSVAIAMPEGAVLPAMTTAVVVVANSRVSIGHRIVYEAAATTPKTSSRSSAAHAGLRPGSGKLSSRVREHQFAPMAVGSFRLRLRGETPS